MVYYNSQARIDLSNILIGLIEWKKHPLEPNHAIQYVSEIRKECDTLDKRIIHINAIYDIHRKYGEKVHIYKRNANTIWYIIYNKIGENIYVEKIINNYMTVS